MCVSTAVRFVTEAVGHTKSHYDSSAGSDSHRLAGGEHRGGNLVVRKDVTLAGLDLPHGMRR